MSQIVVAKTRDGIILAAENRGVQLDPDGEEISLQLKRIVPLTSQGALVAAGAAEGVEMGMALGRFLKDEGLHDVLDLYGASLAFLSTEYERFMRKRCELLPVDPLHHVSFVLAGRTEKDPSDPFRLYYLWTKKKLPRLDGDEITYAFSLPRRMGLEFQLNRLAKEGASLGALIEKIQEALERLRTQGEILAPISLSTITSEGYQSLNP